MCRQSPASLGLVAANPKQMILTWLFLSFFLLVTSPTRVFTIHSVLSCGKSGTSKRGSMTSLAEMIGDVSVSVVGVDGSVKKLAADAAEVDSAEQDDFISAQIFLSDQLPKLGVEAADDNGRDGVDGAASDAAAGEIIVVLF